MADIIENAAAGLERALIYREGRECSPSCLPWMPPRTCKIPQGKL